MNEPRKPCQNCGSAELLLTRVGLCARCQEELDRDLEEIEQQEALATIYDDFRGEPHAHDLPRGYTRGW